MDTTQVREMFGGGTEESFGRYEESINLNGSTMVMEGWGGKEMMMSVDIS